MKPKLANFIQKQHAAYISTPGSCNASFIEMPLLSWKLSLFYSAVVSLFPSTELLLIISSVALML